MATSPLGIQRPPSPPPDVTGQQGGGASPMAPFAAAIGQRVQQETSVPQSGQAPIPGAGGANPAGRFMAMSVVAEKMLKQFAADSPVFAPYAERALQAIQEGVAAVTKSTPGAAAEPAPDSAVTGASGGPPQGAAGAGAGAGFPG